MAESSPPITPRPRQGQRNVPGPRPLPGSSRTSWRQSSTQSEASGKALESQASLSAIGEAFRTMTQSPDNLTQSPEPDAFEDAGPVTPIRPQRSMPLLRSASPKKIERGRSIEKLAATLGSRDSSQNRSQTTPLRAASPASFLASLTGPSTPKARPKPTKLNTMNLMTETATASQAPPISPGMRHWQQVRQHVVTTPVEDKVANRAGRKFALVAKAAERLGRRQQSTNVLAEEEDKRRLSTGFVSGLGKLSKEEQEHIMRERRKFARDVKACLDACAAEETRRRLQRMSDKDKDVSVRAGKPGVSLHRPHQQNSTYAASGYAFDPDFSCFAPLLMELHRYLPDARAKRPWSRTCPHHGAILAELGFTFLPDGASTDGERHQALEIFGVIVRNWAPENASEELDRWVWLIKALMTPDRQLRTRGFSLLHLFLYPDSSLPQSSERPNSALALQTLVLNLLTLLNAIENATYDAEGHLLQITDIINDLMNGGIIRIEGSTLGEVLGSNIADDLEGGADGAEREMMWMATCRITSYKAHLGRWLMADNGSVLKRLLPPPILHATPPMILQLRSRSAVSLLSSLSGLLRSTPSLAMEAWDFAQQTIFPDLELLPDPHGDLAKQLGIWLLQLELVHQHAIMTDDPLRPDDPFTSDQDFLHRPPTTTHRQWLSKYLQSNWRPGIEADVDTLLGADPSDTLIRMIRVFLSIPELSMLGRYSVPRIYEGLTDTSAASPEVRAFFTELQQRYPQLLYKPLFALSASTTLASLTENTRIVQRIAGVIGSESFWTVADPQMVAIVLLGGASAKPSKGKGKEGQSALINVKLGRYACLVNLIEALESAAAAAGKGQKPVKHLKRFAEAVEDRLAPLLEAEERDGRYPDLYRTLLCSLFYNLRAASMSVKRATWQSLVICWFMEAPNGSEQEVEATLLAAYNSAVAKRDNKSSLPGTRQSTILLSGQEGKIKKPILFIPTHDIATRLLVLAQAFLTASDYMSLLPTVWDRYGKVSSQVQPLTFLFMKCAEINADRTRQFVMSQLQQSSSTARLSGLTKLSTIYTSRFDVLTQLIVTDRRGPVFHFPLRTHEFVTTEIGSPHWVPPQDVQDAALRRFGTTLPLELRRRLMELGWTEDDNIASRSEWEQVPVSQMPTLHWLDLGSTGNTVDKMSPIKSLRRRSSTGSGSSFKSKKRRAVFPPILLNVIIDQALLFAREKDEQVSATSLELVKMLQRDDPSLLLRPIIDAIPVDYPQALASLNAITVDLTPGFAYSALNTLVGYLKNAVRSNGDFPYFADTLTIIARLIPSVSEMSLRDVRKNKAEHVLLPASIHEDEGGFNLHSPWRRGQVDVQTSQLLVLAAFLKANPRDVYMVKKMLSNLQIQALIPHLPFARAWLSLIVTLFSKVNRNYNDRAELRHFLSNAAAILHHHGAQDMISSSYAMRIFMLCSARFRRLFASMGFTTVMGSVYDLYAASRGHSGLTDCVEYSMRSFYRLHEDHFVHQTCVIIAERQYDPRAVYALLSCLATANDSSSGSASGLRGLNDKEELEALVQMLSGPELSLADVGHDASERLAHKMANINLDAKIFPKENILRLLATVIAANPSTSKAIGFIRLLAGLTPYVLDEPSKELLRETVEALGSIISKGKVGNEAARAAFHAGADGGDSDWVAARRQYVLLVESYAKSRGKLSTVAIKRTSDVAVELLKHDDGDVSRAVASIVAELAQTSLSPSPGPFLRDLAPLFRTHLDIVDFSDLLDKLTHYIRSAQLDAETSSIIIESYVGPAVRMLATAAENNMVFLLPIRASTITLLAAAVTLPGNALLSLEKTATSPSFLAAVVFPLCLQLSGSRETAQEATFNSLWIRILNYVVRPFRRASRNDLHRFSPPEVAALSVISLQVVKVILVHAVEAISSVRGLWTYLGKHLIVMTGDSMSDGYSSSHCQVGAWMTWSIFQFVALGDTPLRIELGWPISEALLSLDRTQSPLSSPVMKASDLKGLNIRNLNDHNRSISADLNPSPSRHTRELSPHSDKSGHRPRASFEDISARRASRTKPEAFQPSPSKNRFTKRFPSSPSSAPVRSVERFAHGGKRDTIVHMLGTPMSPTSPTAAKSTGGEDVLESARQLVLSDESWLVDTRRGIEICRDVYGATRDDDHLSRPRGNPNDALDTIIEETRRFVEEEFRDVFSPEYDDPKSDRPESGGYSLNQIESRYSDDEDTIHAPILDSPTAVRGRASRLPSQNSSIRSFV